MSYIRQYFYNTLCLAINCLPNIQGTPKNTQGALLFLLQCCTLDNIYKTNAVHPHPKTFASPIYRGQQSPKKYTGGRCRCRYLSQYTGGNKRNSQDPVGHAGMLVPCPQHTLCERSGHCAPAPCLLGCCRIALTKTTDFSLLYCVIILQNL